MAQSTQSALARLLGERIHLGREFSEFTTLRVGGPIDALAEVHTEDELRSLIELAHGDRIPLFVIGNGSNLVASDAGMRGLVVRLGGEFEGCERQTNRVIAGAATPFSFVAQQAAEWALGGLEFAAGIPGTVGGALISNAGAWGQAISDRLVSVRVMGPSARPQTLMSGDLSFGYRTSELADREGIVLSVMLGLEPSQEQAIRKTMEEMLAKRRGRHPLHLPNAGSVFKNPPGNFAGRLLEECGAKGLQVGDAQVSPQHANFIVNLGKASASDVLQLMRQMRERVVLRTGILLENEVRVVDEWGKPVGL